jgi:GNAT superfamily N-acetyltransferase
MAGIVKGPFFGKSSVCEPILCSLPQWFGIEEANEQYIKDIEVLPTFLAFIDDKVVGFLTLKQHNEYAAEIHIMGVFPEVHRKGIGRVLLIKAEEFLNQKGIEYLQVKTLSSSHPDRHYAQTRDFYFAMGFRPLEEFKELWNEENPCLLMVKGLGSKSG